MIKTFNIVVGPNKTINIILLAKPFEHTAIHTVGTLNFNNGVPLKKEEKKGVIAFVIRRHSL